MLLLMEAKLSLACITSATALQVLNIGSGAQKPFSVNICGQIQAVSDIIKVKDTRLFLAKFLPGVDIVVKRKELLQWQPCLIPGLEYVLTGLRPTTLKKGSRHPSRVYTVTEDSQLHTADTVTVKLLSLHEWLKLNSPTTVATDLVPAAGIEDRLFSYKGVITGVLDRLLGVYELDERVRLFAGQVPVESKSGSLQVGEVITIHNAHHKPGNQVHKVFLYNCMLTCITVEKRVTAGAQQERAMPLLVQRYLYLYGMSKQKLDFLFSLTQILKQQFSQLFGIRGVEKILTTVLPIPVLSWEQPTDGSFRNLIDEFLQSPHACNLATDLKEEILPDYLTIKDLLHSVENPPHTDHWNCIRQGSDKQVLLGLLNTCEKTGQCVIYDAAGSVPIITCCCHDNDTQCSFAVSKKCDEGCRCSVLFKGQFFPCQNFHVCCRDKLVAFRRFIVVTETKSDNCWYNASIANDSKYLTYICVDMKNAIILGDKSRYIKRSNTDVKKCEVIKSEERFSRSERTVMGNQKGSDKAEKVNKNGGCISDRKDVFSNMLCSELRQQAPEIRIGADNTDYLKNAPCTTNSDKTGLHRHVQEDGSSRFCRDTTCVQEMDKDQKGNGLKTLNSGTKDLSVCDVNYKTTDFIEKLNETVEEEAAGVSLSVKSVVKRKVVGNCVVTEMESSKLKRSLQDRKDEDRDVNRPGVCEECDQTENSDGKSAAKKADTESVLSNNDLEREPECNSENQKPVLGQRQETMQSNSVDLYIVSREALRHSGQSVDQEQLMACMECIDLRDKTNKLIMLQGPTLRWYPCLQTGHVYRLIAPTGYLPLIAPKISNAKLRKTIQKSNAKSWWTVHDDMVMEELNNLESRGVTCDTTCSQISSVLSLGSGVGQFVETVGLIIKRVVVRRDQQQPVFHLGHLSHDKSNSDSINTRIDLQELGGRQVLQIYMDHRNFVLPHGLVPGAIVRFKKLERKVSQSGNVYCRFVPLSSVDIKCVSSNNISQQNQLTKSCDKQDSGHPTMVHLVDLWSIQDRDALFKCVCDVYKVTKLSLKCVCEYCGSTVVRSRCSNVGCFGGEAREMVARASVIVDDSTCLAMVTMTDKCVQSLLQLSHDQWVCLEKEISVMGEIFVQQTKQLWDSPLEQFVYMMCDNRLIKIPWLMTLRHRKVGKGKLDLDEINMDEFAQKTFDTGLRKITTHCLPFLQLECVAMETFDPVACSALYLTKT